MDTLKIIYDVIDIVNEQFDGVKLEKGLDTIIMGDESDLDSMDLVEFITLIEDKIESQKGYYISISDENVMSSKNSPFRTVSTLKQYIDSLNK
tara:strand:+ start:101 stop:379 length:279 start_codon:yes stop_codon:yes gene_type:complete